MLSFIRRQVLVSLGFAIGAVWTLWGLVAQAVEMWTANLPPAWFAAIGATIFMLSVILLLVRFEAEHHARSGAPDPKPLRWPWRGKERSIDPRLILGRTPEPEPTREPTNEEILYRGELRRFVTLIDSAFRELHSIAAWLVPYPTGESDSAAYALRFFFSRAIEPAVAHMSELCDDERAMGANGRRVPQVNGLLEIEIIGFLTGDYCNVQDNARVFSLAIGVDINEAGRLQSWLTTERACIEQLKALRACPAASDRMRRLPDAVFGLIGERHLRQST